jgi:hypothetical protein
MIFQSQAWVGYIIVSLMSSNKYFMLHKSHPELEGLRALSSLALQVFGCCFVFLLKKVLSYKVTSGSWRLYREHLHPDQPASDERVYQ